MKFTQRVKTAFNVLTNKNSKEYELNQLIKMDFGENGIG